jgi:multicomponent K+:H+ antiporter subunit C
MEWLIALVIGVLTATGVFLTLRARTFPVVLGLTLLAYAINVFLFAMGRLTIGQPSVIDAAATGYSDPLPQALVLTAIVIAFGMTAFLIVLALKARGELGNDHVDGLHLAHDEIAPDSTRQTANTTAPRAKHNHKAKLRAKNPPQPSAKKGEV